MAGGIDAGWFARGRAFVITLAWGSLIGVGGLACAWVADLHEYETQGNAGPRTVDDGVSAGADGAIDGRDTSVPNPGRDAAPPVDDAGALDSGLPGTCSHAQPGTIFCADFEPSLTTGWGNTSSLTGTYFAQDSSFDVTAGRVKGSVTNQKDFLFTSGLTFAGSLQLSFWIRAESTTGSFIAVSIQLDTGAEFGVQVNNGSINVEDDYQTRGTIPLDMGRWVPVVLDIGQEVIISSPRGSAQFAPSISFTGAGTAWIGAGLYYVQGAGSVDVSIDEVRLVAK